MKLYQNAHRHSMFTNARVPDSVARNEAYAIRAKELGHKIISTMEHGSQGRYIEGYELAKKYDLTFLFGTEAYWVKDRFEKDNTNAHICLFAKTENARQCINDVLSEANISGFYYRPRLDLDLILSLPKDEIICTTACIAFWQYEDIDNIVLKLNDHFKHFYLEVQNHNTDSQKKLNSHILQLSEINKIPTIFGVDSHYISNDREWERTDYLASKGIFYEHEQGWYLDYPDGDTAYQRFINQGILTPKQINESMDNTNIYLDVEKYDSPIFNKEIKMPSLYPDLSQQERDKIYKNLIKEKWNEIKNSIPIEEHKHYIQEIKKEVDDVITTKHSDYFLIDYALINEGIKNGGMLTNSGRGSSVSYITNRLLGFTKIDRVSAKVKMYPERFISPTRILESKSLADIDLNLGNPEIFAQAQTKIFGKDHSYPMIAYGTYKAKSAFKMYAKAKDMDFELANEISQQIEGFEKAVKYAEDDEKDDINIYDFVDEKYHSIIKDSEEYLGIISDLKVHPCFDKDTLIMTNNGYKNIDNIIIDDYVLTHKNRYQKVTNIMKKECNELYEVDIIGDKTLVTGNHPFYTRRKISGYEYNEQHERIWIKKYSKPQWKTIENIDENDRIGFAINQKSELPDWSGTQYYGKTKNNLPFNDKNFWWLIGRYIGDGWNYNPKKHDYRIVICCNKNNNETQEILNKVPQNFRPRVSEDITTNKICINNKLFYDYLQQFGKGAGNKHLTKDIFNLPIQYLDSFIKGYISADGYIYKDNKTISFTTISKQLAYGLQNCIHKAYHSPCTIHTVIRKNNIIEGRICNTKKQYLGRFKTHTDKKDRNFYEDGYVWLYFKSKKNIPYNNYVYNLEVENDHSYTANNCIVHNCAHLIYQGNIRKEIGLIKTKSKSGKEKLCTIMDGKWAEDYKFLKNDLLKVDVVKIIKLTYKRIGIPEHDEHELIKICEGNQRVWDIYKNGYTMGINQCEKSSTKHKAMRYKMTNISELCAFVAGIRPSFKSMYNTFEKREPFEYGVKAFDNVIQTEEMPASFILYQEQIMSALNFAGVPMSECYDVIKNISKKREEKVKAYKDIFLEGFANKVMEIDQKTLEEAKEISSRIWTIISNSCQYGFNASHAYCVAIDSLYGAYLKSTYPLQFYETFLNVLQEKTNAKDRITLTKKEANKAFGITFPPMQFGQDNNNFTLDEENNCIYPSMNSIKTIGAKVANELYQLSISKKYLSFLDLLIDLKEKTSLDKSQIKILIKLNYFSQFGKTQYLLTLYEYFQILYNKKTIKKEKVSILNIDEQIIKSNCEKITDMQYNKINWYKIISEVEKSILKKSISVYERIMTEFEYLGYISSTFPDLKYPVYFITEIDLKYTPKLKLYNLQNGEEEQKKIYKKQYNKLPMLEKDLIYISGTQTKNKVKKAGEEIVKGKVKIIWEELDETEEIILNYSKPNYEKFNTYINKLENMDDYQDQRVI